MQRYKKYAEETKMPFSSLVSMGKVRGIICKNLKLGYARCNQVWHLPLRKKLTLLPVDLTLIWGKEQIKTYQKIQQLLFHVGFCFLAIFKFSFWLPNCGKNVNIKNFGGHSGECVIIMFDPRMVISNLNHIPIHQERNIFH